MDCPNILLTVIFTAKCLVPTLLTVSLGADLNRLIATDTAFIRCLKVLIFKVSKMVYEDSGAAQFCLNMDIIGVLPFWKGCHDLLKNLEDGLLVVKVKKLFVSVIDEIIGWS